MPLREGFRFHKLSPTEDVFHHFQWPNKTSIGSEGPSGQGGRPPYRWTAKLSRELIDLVIHMDITIDEIPIALKDTNGRGPCKTTCRKRWHEIFGYDPSAARLYDAERQSYRKERQISAFLSGSAISRPTHDQFMPPSSRYAPGSTISHSGVSRTNDGVGNIEYRNAYPPGFIRWIKQAVLQHDRSSTYLQLDPEQRQYGSLNSRTVAGIGQASICEMLQTRSATDSSLPLLTAPVETLLQDGANVNEANGRGETPLHLAVALGHITITTLLLEYGADPHRMTHAGESTWEFGRKASQRLMATAVDDEDASEILERSRAYARIEFARSTVEFNPNLVIKGRSRREDRSSAGRSEHAFPNVPMPELPWLNQGPLGEDLMVAPASPPGHYVHEPNQFENLMFFPDNVPRTLEEELLDTGEWS